MGLFLITSENEDHSHLVFMRGSGDGFTSRDGKKEDEVHVHSVLANLETNEFVVDPSPEDPGHIHEVAPMPQKDTSPKGEDPELVARVAAFWMLARNIEFEALKDADESEKFYRGGKGQWKAEDITAMDAEERARCTSNEIEPKLDVLHGYEADNQTDMRVMAVGGGDQGVADILNIVVKNVAYNNEFQRKKSKVFEDMTVGGRGAFDVYESYERYLEGEIKVDRFPGTDIVMGPHEDDAGDDCEFICKHKMYSRSKLKQLFPAKSKEIDGMMVKSSKLGADVRHIIRNPEYDIDISKKQFMSFIGDKSIINRAAKEVRVIECQYIEYEKVKVLVVLDDKDRLVKSTINWPAEWVTKASKVEGVKVVPRVLRRFRRTIIGGAVLLEDSYMDEGSQDPGAFEIVVAYGKKRGNYFWSKTHSMKDPQRMQNKWDSKFMDVLNRMTGQGWFIDGQTFDTPDDEKHFKDNSSKSGWVQKITDMNRKPEPSGGLDRIPVELIQGAEMAHKRLEGIANIPPSIDALRGANTSGRALLQKEKRGLIGNNFLFVNLAMAQKRVGRLILKLVRKLYKDRPGEIYRMIDAERLMDDEQNLKIGGQSALDENGQLSANWVEANVREMLEGDDLLRYDVVVADARWTPTMREAYFQQLVEMKARGDDIPLPITLELSSMPVTQKEKLNRIWQQQQEQRERENQMKYGTEIEKANIAARSKSDTASGGAA